MALNSTQERLLPNHISKSKLSIFIFFNFLVFFRRCPPWWWLGVIWQYSRDQLVPGIKPKALCRLDIDTPVLWTISFGPRVTDFIGFRGDTLWFSWALNCCLFPAVLGIMKSWRIKLRNLPYKASTQHFELSLRPGDTTCEGNSQFSRRKQGSEGIKGPLSDHSTIGDWLYYYIYKEAVIKIPSWIFGLLERADFITLWLTN